MKKPMKRRRLNEMQEDMRQQGFEYACDALVQIDTAMIMLSEGSDRIIIRAVRWDKLQRIRAALNAWIEGEKMDAEEEGQTLAEIPCNLPDDDDQIEPAPAAP